MRRSLPFYLLLLGLALLVSLYARLVVAEKPEDFDLHADAPLWVFLHMLLAVAVIDRLNQWLARRGRPPRRAVQYVRLLAGGGAVFLSLLTGLVLLLKLLDPHQPFEVEWNAYALLRYFGTTLVMYLLVYNCYLLFRYSQAESAAQVRLQTAEKERARAELRAMQQHINPHFLFNNLNVLSALIEPANDRAQQYLGHLSALYRHLLRHHEQEMIPLRDELAFADDFMYLLQIRFGAAYR
ncbi:MAG TPA: histidine kinase, partial [Hymenobacter sp.]